MGTDWVPGARLAGSRIIEAEPPADAPVVGVLALQGDVLEHLRALAEAGARPVRVRSLADLDSVDGLVIPGGESTTIGMLLDRAGMLHVLRGRAEDGMPMFGTCAGLILLSRELAQERLQHLIGVLDVTTRRNAFGRQVDSFETDLTVVGMDRAIPAVFIRAPWIERVGAEVDVLASVGDHAVLVSQGHLLAASFHPELTGDRRLHAMFVDRVRDAVGRRGAARAAR